MDAIAPAPAASATWQDADSRPLSWAHARIAALAIATVLAFGFRLTALSTYGLSQDELNKVHAVEQYRAGHFTANAEHPMLMKLAMWASLDLARSWNRVAPAEQAISVETALRVPNAVAGAVITLTLFGVADLLFGGAVAVAASFIWACDVNAIAINRIGKEDTFLLLFFLLAVFCYERAKKIGAGGRPDTQRWYALSGVSFGLMLASKYMPHYLGIYALFNTLTDPDPGSNKPERLRHYGAMAAAFLAANIAILMPATWRYCVSYVQGGMLPHHGYLYAGTLYVTNIPISPLGAPVTYYLRLIGTKVPLALLAAAAAGVVQIVRRRDERGFVLLRVLFVFVLVPYSLMAAKFLRYSLSMLAVIDLTAGVGLVAAIGWLLGTSRLPRPARIMMSSLALAAFAASLVASPRSAAPFYSLFQNAVGVRIAAPGTTFPEETYDYGVREAVASIARSAGPAAVVVSDAPDVVAHYLASSGRPDVEARSLSGAGMPPSDRETWVIVQDEHATFENRGMVERLRARETPVMQFRAGDALAAQVFRLGGR